MTDERKDNSMTDPHHRHDHGGTERQKQGITSFEMQDSEIVFDAIALSGGNRFVDLGCGAGDYALRAAEEVGPTGTVYALDRWPELAEAIMRRAAEKNLANVRALVCDISGSLPLQDGLADVCFMANVLHGFNLATDADALFGEMRRVLKPGGRMAVLEFKKVAEPQGPPLEVRIAPDEIAAAAARYGFAPMGAVDLGRTYLAQFVLGA